MVLYTVGRRIKNFIKVIILSDFKSKEQQTISGKQFLKNDAGLDEGKVRWYYDNRKLKSECTYRDGKLEGISTHFYQSGNLKAKENYVRNKLQGLSIRYYENGKIMSEETYREGTLIFIETFDETGKKTGEKRS